MIDMPGKKLLRLDGRTFEVCWSDEPDDPAWDDFLVSIPGGHHEQTSLWGQVRARCGWQIARFSLKEQGRIIAGAQAQLKPLGRFGNFAYLTYGPCISSEEVPPAKVLVAELKSFLSALGVSCAVVGLPYRAPGLVRPLEKSGFFRKPYHLHPHFIETTLVVDLAKDSREILAGMRASTRKNVRLALKRGIEVVEGGALHLDTFRELMFALCKRRKTSPNPPQPDFFHQVWERFHPKGWIKLFIAMNGREPVSAAVAFPFRDWFRVWKVGWSGRHGNLRPNEALWWAMIQYAQKNGFRYFDFVNIDPAYARAAASGQAPAPRTDGATFFKLGFGGEIRLLPGAYLYFSSPAVRTAMRLGLGKFLDSDSARRIMEMGRRRCFGFK